MPLNDMAMFETYRNQKNMDVDLTDIKEMKSATQWNEALLLFWSVNPPRVIVALAGGRIFYVASGPNLRFLPRDKEVDPSFWPNCAPDCLQNDRRLRNVESTAYVHPSGACLLSSADRTDCAEASNAADFGALGCVSLGSTSASVLNAKTDPELLWDRCYAQAQVMGHRYFGLQREPVTQCHATNDVATALQLGPSGKCRLKRDRMGRNLGASDAVFWYQSDKDADFTHPCLDDVTKWKKSFRSCMDRFDTRYPVIQPFVNDQSKKKKPFFLFCHPAKRVFSFCRRQEKNGGKIG